MASAQVMDVSDGDFKEKVLQSPTPVLVDFWATWCAPCRAIAPVIDELATQYSGQVKMVKLNVDDNQQIAQQYGIRSIPVLLLFKGGQVVEQLVGAQDAKKRIETAISKVV